MVTQKKPRRKGSSQKDIDERGKSIIQGGVVLDLGHGRYKVSSQSVADAFYDVTVTDNCWRCTCAYHIHGNRRCKHISAVRDIVENIREAPGGTHIIEDPGVACVSCDSRDCRYRETRHNKRTVSERYVCRNCGKKFTHNPGFVGRHYDADTITDVLQDVAMGKSPEQVAQGLAKKRLHPDQATIWRWAKHYGNMLRTLSNSVAYLVGYDWSADEIYYKVKGEEMWLFGVMDKESRFVIDYEPSPIKFGYNATKLFRSAINLAKKTPDAITTDALSGFEQGFNSTMTSRRGTRILHRKDAGINKRHANNNTYERFNGTIRRRLKCVNGFQAVLPTLHVLFLAYYNFFRPHLGIEGKTPAEAIGVVLKGTDKWLTAIRYAALFCT